VDGLSDWLDDLMTNDLRAAQDGLVRLESVEALNQLQPPVAAGEPTADAASALASASQFPPPPLPDAVQLAERMTQANLQTAMGPRADSLGGLGGGGLPT
jgi:hypothetical protein